ncbi:MAG: 3-isopropylmalate dehydratase small subunit [Acidimicrobiia bacterium]
MEPVTEISGTAAPLPRANVDTDQIIPKQFLKRIERSGFGEFLFYDWSADAEGELDPDFVLNKPQYSNAVVLVAGPNFGSGSSREHAPWALHDWGFRAIIAPSFADIFANNCINVGLLPVVLTPEQVTSLTIIADDPTNTVTIDLHQQTVAAGDFIATFEIDAFDKHRLVNGLDHISLSMEHGHHIASHEDSRAHHKPTVE